MRKLFSGCSSLISLPDISKYNTSKAIKKSDMFIGYNLIKIFPDLSHYFEIVYKYKQSFRIFDEIFVQKNKNVCYIEYNFKNYPLCEYFKDIDNHQFHENEKIMIKIKIININMKINMSCMFKGCRELLSVNIRSDFLNDKIFPKDNNLINSDISLTSEETNNGLSNIDKDLAEKSDILSFGQSTIPQIKFSCQYIMEDIYFENPALSDFLDYDLSYMFSECESLIWLPDMSKWDISKVTNMESIFSQCKSLKSLPGILLMLQI